MAQSGSPFWRRMLNGPNIGRRLAAIFFAHVIMGLAVVLLRLSLFGNDPFSCMNLGFSIVSGFSYGTCVVLFNLVLIVPVWFLDKSYIQFGTLVNMFLLGPIADVWYDLLCVYPVLTEATMTVRIMLLISGVIITTIACSLYMCTKFGMGPYDAIGWIIAARSGGRMTFRSARVAVDSTAVCLGFLCGSIVGLGTLIMATGTGPLINLWNERLSMPLLYGRQK